MGILEHLIDAVLPHKSARLYSECNFGVLAGIFHIGAVDDRLGR